MAGPLRHDAILGSFKDSSLPLPASQLLSPGPQPGFQHGSSSARSPLLQDSCSESGLSKRNGTRHGRISKESVPSSRHPAVVSLPAERKPQERRGTLTLFVYCIHRSANCRGLDFPPTHCNTYGEIDGLVFQASQDCWFFSSRWMGLRLWST